MSFRFSRTAVTASVFAVVMVLAAVGCTPTPLLRESARPVYMDVPVNAQLEDAAVNTAVEVLHRFSGGSASKDVWLRNLTPLVTTSFAQETEDIDPPYLKPATVRAAALESPQLGTGNQVRVRIGTDAREWIIVMTTSGAGAPWLASSIFPASLT